MSKVDEKTAVVSLNDYDIGCLYGILYDRQTSIFIRTSDIENDLFKILGKSIMLAHKKERIQNMRIRNRFWGKRKNSQGTMYKVKCIKILWLFPYTIVSHLKKG